MPYVNAREKSLVSKQNKREATFTVCHSVKKNTLTVHISFNDTLHFKNKVIKIN
jgi:hypothetical protein